MAGYAGAWEFGGFFVEMKLGKMHGGFLRQRREVMWTPLLAVKRSKPCMGQIKAWIFRAFLKGDEGQQNGGLCWITAAYTAHRCFGEGFSAACCVSCLDGDALSPLTLLVFPTGCGSTTALPSRWFGGCSILWQKKSSRWVVKAPFLNKPFYSPDSLSLLET